MKIRQFFSKKRLLFGCSSLILILFVSSFFVYQSKDWWLQAHFDFTQDNPYIDSKEKIDAVFARFKQVSYKELDKAYLDYSLSNDKRFKKMLQKSAYFIVPQSELNRYIVGHFRIKEFMGKDKYVRQCILGNTPTVYWLIDKRIIYKTLELQEALAQKSYDKDAFKISNGHRHPQYNERIKGARKSRHIKGEAIDIRIGDIDKDGDSDAVDKKIVLDLLDKKIIKDKGGLGLYPGTQAVHYDVRGYKARWNSFKR